MTRPNRLVRPFVMDQPILHPFVAELRESERLRAFAEAFPAPARVSEPALPLLLAALHEELGRPLVVLAPEDQDARDAAEGASWFLGDVFPTTGREPLRVEFWGDEVEQMRAFSPFTQRALHPVELALIYPATERRLDLLEATLAEDEVAVPVRRDLVLPVPDGPDLVWQRDEVRAVWEEEGLEPLGLADAAVLDPLPAGQPFAFEAQRPALAA